MDDKLIIDASRVDPEGEEIEGEVECIDLDEEFVKPFGGVRYRLNLQVFSDKSPEVDLTEDVRESIILALPTYPVCAEACPGIEQKVEMPKDDCWGALEGLKVEG